MAEIPDPLEEWEKELAIEKATAAAAEFEEDYDPFSPEVAPGLSLVVQLRIYDVLMAILKENNADAAREILELHSKGGLAGPSPNFSGFFATDELNGSNDEE